MRTKTYAKNRRIEKSCWRVEGVALMAMSRLLFEESVHEDACSPATCNSNIKVLLQII